MPGSTPTFGFPYQTSGDAPNGPLLGQQLAEAVEALLVAKQTQSGTAELSTATTLGTSLADLPGASVTVNTTRTNAKALVTWSADYQVVTSGSTNVAYTLIAVDGVDQPQNAVWGPLNLVAGCRATVASSFTITLPSPGSHTFKMRGAATSSSGAIRANNIHTQVSVLVLS